jgi:hypothetical protein
MIVVFASYGGQKGGIVALFFISIKIKVVY